MALLESLDIPLGTLMPAFELKDPSSAVYSSEKLCGAKGLLVVFTCNHCPYAKAVWPRVIRIGKYAKPLGINTVAINPNVHPDYPEDAPGEMKKKIKEWGIPFPYLIDESQDVARTFKAQCTPDPYLFDASKRLVYHGRVDDNWQDESKVKVQDLKNAVTALAEGKPIAPEQFPAMGCSIKWRDVKSF
ncbi:MAG: thioredoxin family protein [Bacteroidota bacterium]